MSLPKVFDSREFKMFFKHRFSEFLKSNYGNPEEVAHTYGVRFQTALNWWQGTNAPSGDTVTMVSLRHGGDYTEFMGEGL